MAVHVPANAIPAKDEGVLISETIRSINVQGEAATATVDSDGNLTITIGAAGTGWDGEVNTYADLPSASANSGAKYLVLQSSGLWMVNRKPAGLYRSDGASWSRLGDWTAAFNTTNFKLYDNADPTKQVAFDTSSVTAGATRTLYVPDKEIHLAGTEDLKPNPSSVVTFVEDFHNASTTSLSVGDLGWTQTITGTGSQTTGNFSDTPTRPGVRRFIIGNAATAVVNLSLSQVCWPWAGQGAVTIYIGFRLVTLANATDDFVIQMGLGDSTTNAYQTDGVFFNIDKSVNGAYGDIRGVCVNNGVMTDTGSNDVNLSVATWYRGRIEINSDGTQVDFYLNGVKLGNSITTNIPTGRNCGPTLHVYKTASSTNISALDVDYFTVYQSLTTAR